MESIQMGRLIRALRRERGLTQKALAQQLHVTDKAVSKWERDLSCPDIALLGALAGALGTTADRLLAGEPGQDAPAAAPAPGTKKTPAARDPQTLRRRCAAVWVLLLAVGVLVCGVCDLSTGGRGWALYPALSCLLAGAVTVWPILRGAKGVLPALLWLSVLIGPFLYALDRLIAAEASILPVGLAAAGLGLALLWGCYGAARHWRTRPLRAGAACAGLCAAANLAVNLALARLLNIPLLDGWDLLTLGLLAALAAALLLLDLRPAGGSGADQE